jgi:hypothetical protein
MTPFIDHLYTHDSWLHFTGQWHKQTSVLSLLQSSTAVSWQRILIQELEQFHWMTHIKSSHYNRTSNWALLQLNVPVSTDHIENTVPLLLYHCSVRVCCCRNVFTELLPRNGSVYLFISRSLHSNGSTRYSIFITFSEQTALTDLPL